MRARSPSPDERARHEPPAGRARARAAPASIVASSIGLGDMDSRVDSARQRAGQALADRSPRIRAVAGLQAIADGHLATTTRPLQRRHVEATGLAVERDRRYGGDYDLKADGAMLPYPYVNYDYIASPVDVESRSEAISELQEGLRDIGAKAPAAAMAKSIRPPSKKEGPKATEWTDQKGRGWVPSSPALLWPFAVDIDFDYENRIEGDGQRGALGIEVFFAPGNYGYVTEVRGDGDDFYQMGINYERQTLHLPEMAEEEMLYDAKHAEGGTSDEMKAAVELAGTRGADSLTKVVAEGARWNAVAALGARGGLTNQSWFYPSTNRDREPYKDTEKPPAIRFEVLWKRWQDFKNDWAITDATLKESLLTGKVHKYTASEATLAELRADDTNYDLG